MVRPSARALAVVAAAGALLAAACSDDDGQVETFEVSVSSDDTANSVFNEALLTAVELCQGEDPPLRVQWEFAEQDREHPVAIDYQRQQMPGFVDCASIQSGDPSEVPGADLDTPDASELLDSADPSEADPAEPPGQADPAADGGADPGDGQAEPEAGGAGEGEAEPTSTTAEP